MVAHHTQRVRSWDMSEYAYAYKFFWLLVTTRKKTIRGTIILKLFQLYSCYTLVADALRIPVIVLILNVSPMFFSWFLSGAT